MMAMMMMMVMMEMEMKMEMALEVAWQCIMISRRHAMPKHWHMT